MKNKCLKIMFLLLFCSFLYGCKDSKQDNYIQFIKDDVIEYSNDFKISSLIEKVENFTYKDFSINQNDTILTLPNKEEVLINVSKKKIKLDTIEFIFKYKDKSYKKRVLIKDSTSPKIECLNKYEVEKGNKYFVLENLISCKDNCSSEDEIKLFYNGNYDIDKIGKYSIEIIAYDKEKNKSSKNILIDVVDRKVNTQYIKPKQDNTPNEPYSSNKDDKVIKRKKTGYKPKTKQFTINKYDSFDICLKECEKYINTCIDNGYRGKANAIPIKKNGLYIGYQAIFE